MSYAILDSILLNKQVPNNSTHLELVSYCPQSELILCEVPVSTECQHHQAAPWMKRRTHTTPRTL